ncbi:MAG: radical SAM protein [bacterium]
MRVLLIAANQGITTVTPAPPIGLLYLASSLQKGGHEAYLLDLMFEPDLENSVAGAIDLSRPDLIGISIRNIDNLNALDPQCYLPIARQIVQVCRALSGAPLIIGGAGFSAAPEGILRYLDVSQGIVGEGEEAIVQIADRLSAGASLHGVPGLVLLEGDRVSYNPPKLIMEPDTLPFPSRDLLDPSYDTYPGLHFVPVHGILSVRGCIFGCVQCHIPKVMGKCLRRRKPSLVVDEIEQMCSRTGEFYFLDSCFTADLDYVRAICREMLDRKINVGWHCASVLNDLPSDLIELMMMSGCGAIDFDLPSLSNRMLKNFNLPPVVEKVKNTIRRCQEYGLLFTLGLIFGGPGENRSTIQETHEALLELDPFVVHCNIGVAMYPDTALARYAAEEGRSVDERNYWPVYYTSPETRTAMDLIYSIAYDHPTWLFNGISPLSDTSPGQKSG